jgi:hypothetical protein
VTEISCFLRVVSHGWCDAAGGQPDLFGFTLSLFFLMKKLCRLVAVRNTNEGAVMSQKAMGVFCMLLFLGLPLLSQVGAIEIPEPALRTQAVVLPPTPHNWASERAHLLQHLTGRTYVPFSRRDEISASVSAAEAWPPQRLFRLSGR